jgi:hypothetical protein
MLHEMMDVKGPTSAVAQGGIFRWNDGRTCPDLLTGVYEYPGFILEITANLGSGRQSPVVLVAGSEASLTLTPHSVQVTFEPPVDPAPSYGLSGWTNSAKQKYLDSAFGVGKRPQAPPQKTPQELPVEARLEHWQYFIESLREGKPSRETAEDGFYAAGACHLGNLAYRQGRRMRWDLETGKVTEA